MCECFRERWQKMYLKKANCSRLLITWTLANLNFTLTLTKINFPWISIIQFPAILSTVTQTLDTSLQVILYIFLSLITRTSFVSAWHQNRHCTSVQNILFVLKQPSNICPFLHYTKCISSVRVSLFQGAFNFSACILLLNSLLRITWTPNNSNLFQFPWKVWVIASQLYCEI